MNKNFISLLSNPETGSPYQISRIYDEKDGEILEAELSCGKENTITVTGGIPRFTGDIRNSVKLQTIDKFGYEWTTFTEYNVDNFSRWIHSDIQCEFFKGKLGLDAGCGGGRHLQRALSLGAQMIGVDISHSVDLAYQRNSEKEKFMIIQCDIEKIPIKMRSLDFIYSLGVLMHLPDPEKGFRSLLPLIKPGGIFLGWVYQKTFRKRFLEVIRAITKKFPNRLLHIISIIVATLEYFLIIKPYRYFSHLQPLQNIVPSHIKEYAKHNYLVVCTDWFDRLSAPVSNFYSLEDLEGWMRRAGVETYALEPDGDFGWKIMVRI